VRTSLPADLEPPIPALSGDALRVAQRAALDAVAQDERDRARLYARAARNRAEVARLWSARRGSGVMELAGTARIGQDRATRQSDDGVRLVGCFPHAMTLLERGVMYQGTAEMLLGLTQHLTTELQAQMDTQVSAQVAGLDAKDARHVIVTAVAELLDAEQARAEHEQARAQRGVWVKPVEHGMARIGAETDQVTARRWALDFEELVRAEKVLDARTGRVRTTQQRRADVFAELPSRHLALIEAIQQGRAGELPALAREQRAAAGALDGALDGTLDGTPLSVTDLAVTIASLPVRNPVTMYVHIPVSTVLDLDQRSGFVEGLGVVPAFQARLLRPVASLARLWVDCDTGVPLGVDPKAQPPVCTGPPPDPQTAEQAAAEVRRRLLNMLRPTAICDDAEPQHDPSAALRRLVEIRDLGCDGPGCAVPARRCELDHDTPYLQEGQTAVWNLKSRSPRCHHGKHDGWTVTRHPDGSSTWTSPTDRTYHRRSRWRPPPLPEPRDTLPTPRPDRLDDTDPREDWHLPLWRSDEPNGF
jgi:hypothetical protein